MKRATLEAMGLEKEQIDQILDENSADIGRERAKADAKQEKISALEGELSKKDAEIEALKKANPEGLRNKLDELQKKYDADIAAWEEKEAKRTYEERRAAFFGDTTFTDDYTKRGILAEFDEKGFDYDEASGTFKDADTWLSELKNSVPTAFRDPKTIPQIVNPSKGDPGDMSITADQFKNMTYMEKLKFKNEQPDAYKVLKTAE